MRAFLPGIYPRSEALVQATRDLDRGRTTPEAVEEQVERDQAALVQAQQEAGFDLLADGMLRWQDLFRPVLDASAGLEPGALTRFLDTNSFFRAPSATSSEASLDAPLDGRYVPGLPAARLVTLPSPWALSRGTGLAPSAVARDVLRPVVEALAADVELVVLAEPFFARETEADVDELGSAVAALNGGRALAFQLAFSDAGPALGRGLGELPVDAIGIDFHATRLDDVPAGLGKTVLAGVVNARSSLLEDADEVAAFAARLRERVEDVALVPNGDLQYVSEPIAREKVARLGQAKGSASREAA